MEIGKMMCRSILMGTVLLSMVFLAACNNDKINVYTIGVINDVPVLDNALAGFKEGMAGLGYIEGKNIRYVYNGATTDMDKLPAAAHALLAAKPDLIFSITTPATLAVKQAATGTGLPQVFTIVTDPVGAGIVDSLQNPGGNITGVCFGIQEARRLEWLIKIAPGIRKIYVPFNPNDKSPVLALKIVNNAATRLGIELITREVADPETLNDAVLNIPAQADAVFLLPDSLMATRLPDMAATANKHKLPTSVSNITTVETYGVLTAFGFDQHLSGKQASRQADQIFKGARPADLPVETAEFFLAINLKTAKAIGLDIPEDILYQARFIVR
ncbi:MAG: ABC transporter substrate-binding protein [Pseudomonadota bacterium]